MKSEIDFESYSLEELYESARLIDREKFPERAAHIDKLILDKKRNLPKPPPNRFYYGRNKLNLFSGILHLCLSAIPVYLLYNRNALNFEFDFPQYVLTLVLGVCFAFFAIKYLMLYVKLHGVERFIQLKDGVLSMPEHSHSCKQVDIRISDINELYYRSVRSSFGVVSMVEIAYGHGNVASITAKYLNKREFDAICEQLRTMLNLDKIKTKY